MTAHDIESDYAAIKDDLAKLRADVANLTAALRETTSDTLHEQAASARAELNRLAGDAKDKGQQRLDALTGQIEEKPLASILIAFGVGLLFGRILDR